MASKAHTPLDTVGFYCNEETSRRFCIWDKAVLDILGKCQKTSFIEHEMFLRYLLLPALKQSQSPDAEYHIGRDILVSKRFGITFGDFAFPYLAERISRLYASGVPEMLNKQEISLQRHFSRKTLHVVEHSKLFSWWNCIMTRFGYCNNEINPSFESEKLKKQYIRKREDAKRDVIHDKTKNYVERSPVSAVKIHGNISSLFALVATGLVFSVVSFCCETLSTCTIEPKRKVVQSKRVFHYCLLFSTIKYSRLQLTVKSIMKTVKMRFPFRIKK